MHKKKLSILIHKAVTIIVKNSKELKKEEKERESCHDYTFIYRHIPVSI